VGANAIVIAQRAGETDEEIAHVTGYTVPMIRAVLRTSA
jgi:predicted transcriptional regulator